jgi:hypothetical protein
MAHQSNQCRVSGCKRTQVYRGYCQQCFDNFIQYETLGVLQEISQDIKALTDVVKSNDMPLKCISGKSDMGASSLVGVSKKITDDDTPPYIPTGTLSTDVNVSRKSEIKQKNITDIAQQLKNNRG